MNTYTFILEFRGGTYISQVTSSSLNDAVLRWAQNLNGVQHFGETSREELKKQVKEDTPTLIQGMENVWFTCFRIRKGFMRLNIVKS